MGVAIRPATADDIDRVLNLWLDAEVEPGATDDPASLKNLIHHDPGSLLVAEAEGQLIGSIIAGWDGWRGSIYRLAVHPLHRRRGLAGRLLSAAERRLASLGAKRSQAFVVSSDQVAIGFWQASGWRRQVRRARFVKG